MILDIFLTDILPIFVIAGAGFLLAHRYGTQAQSLSQVVLHVALPCLVYDLLVSAPDLGPDAARLVGLGVARALVMAGAGWVVATLLGLTPVDRRAFLLIATFANVGNYGLPVVQFAFGAEALAFATIFFITGSVLTYTLGVLFAAGARGNLAASLRGIVTMPAMQAAALALVVRAAGLSTPEPLMRPISLLSGATLPLMIVVLGMQLHRAGRPTRLPVVAAGVAVSLIGGPLVALGLCEVMGIGGAARQAAVTLSSMPVAVSTAIIAVEYDVSPELVTGAVLISTVLSPLTLTPLIAYLGA